MTCPGESKQLDKPVAGGRVARIHIDKASRGQILSFSYWAFQVVRVAPWPSSQHFWGALLAHHTSTGTAHLILAQPRRTLSFGGRWKAGDWFLLRGHESYPVIVLSYLDLRGTQVTTSFQELP